MDMIPKIIACLFLIRTLKIPLIYITSGLSLSSTPIWALCFFLLGESGFWGIPKVLPALLSSVWMGQNLITNYYIPVKNQISKIQDFKLSSFSDIFRNSINSIKQYFKTEASPSLLSIVTNATAYFTGWAVVDSKSLTMSLPIDYFLNNLILHPLWAVLLLFVGIYITKYNRSIISIFQLLYLSLFLGGNHLSFTFMFGFIIMGLLTRKDQIQLPFFSYYLVESILTVGTLFTAAPTNLLFAVGSIVLVWQLARITDKTKTPGSLRSVPSSNKEIGYVRITQKEKSQNIPEKSQNIPEKSQNIPEKSQNIPE